MNSHDEIRWLENHPEVGSSYQRRETAAETKAERDWRKRTNKVLRLKN